MRRTGLLLTAAAALPLAAAVAVARLGGDGGSDAPVDRAKVSATAPAVSPAPGRERPQTLVVRRRGGVPRGWATRLEGVRGVVAVSRIGRSQALLRRTRDRRGATVETAPDGYAFPLDVLVVSPRSYASALPPAARPAIRRLMPGSALLSRTSAALRRIGAGARLTLADGRTLRVLGVLDDDLVRTAELVVSPRDAGPGGLRSPQLMVSTTQPQRVAAALPGGRALRISSFPPRARPSRGGIARPAELKARFGEFAVGLPYGADRIRIDPRWPARNVRTRSVPILGPVTCNRRFFAPLRAALGALERRGLSRLVDRADYAGCYAPRRIPGSGSLSLHAWGLAIDLNAARNPQYGSSRHDPRLVRAMERAGFTWGGRWPTAPDPMHFELQRPAARDAPLSAQG